MRTTTNDIDIPDQTGTLAVVTGANSGTGFGVSQRLAAAGALVILAVRNTDKGNQAAQAIRAASPHAQVVVEQLDLASLASVEAFAAKLLIRDQPINTLVLQRHFLSSSRGKDGNLWSLQDLQDASPSSLFAPALIATDHGLPGPEALGKVSPGRTGLHDPQDALHDLTMLDRRTPCGSLLRQERAQLFPQIRSQRLQAY